MDKVNKFIRFSVRWIANNLTIPFWMVGHIHLSTYRDVYEDLTIILSSIGMNILVAIGFWIEWKNNIKQTRL